MTNFILRLRSDERGATIIELALAVPFFAALLIGIIDLSRAYSMKLKLEQSAQRAIEKIEQQHTVQPKLPPRRPLLGTPAARRRLTIGSSATAFASRPRPRLAATRPIRTRAMSPSRSATRTLRSSRAAPGLEQTPKGTLR